MPSFKHWLKYIAIAVAAILATLLLLLIIREVAIAFAYEYSYSYFFKVLTSESGVNAWLARAISILFAAAIATAVWMLFSFRGRRRVTGLALILALSIAFSLLVFSVSPSATGVHDSKLVGPIGNITTWYFKTDDGQWRFYRHPAYTVEGPNYGPMGESLAPVTPEVARQYEAEKRQTKEKERLTAVESERQARFETERRFRESQVNEAILLSSAAAANRVLLAVKRDQAQSEQENAGDALQGALADLLARKNKRPVSGAFKAVFYRDGLFDQLWSGDQSIVESLGLFDDGTGCLLLCKASFSEASKSDLEGIVSVQGSLSLIRLAKEVRNGPWVFTASGAGGDVATASANCAKRLAEAFDVDLVFGD